MKIALVLLVALLSVIAQETPFASVNCTFTSLFVSNGGDGHAEYFRVPSSISIISRFEVAFSSDGPVKFVVFSYPSKQLLFASAPQNFSTDDGSTFHSSGPINITLSGQDIAVGIVTEKAATYCGGRSTTTSNVPITGYESPVLQDPSPASSYLSFRIYGTTAAPPSVCGNGQVEGSEQCDGGACCTRNCTFASNSIVCRSSAGACDVTESCLGTSADCPADSFQSNSTVCRQSAGSCDVAEFCSGTDTGCPADSFQSSSTVCRQSHGDCDVAEHCSGTSTACPDDAFQSNSIVCRQSAGSCDVAESCSGSAAECPADRFSNSSTVCRPSAGACDVAESCSGSSPFCPSDMFRSTSFVCRPAANSCDIAESCTGTSNQCPADQLSQSGPCYCARRPNSNDVQYFCSASNSTVYYQCLGGQLQSQSALRPCGAGTSCGCTPGYNNECSCGGNQSPCVRTGTRLQCSRQ